MGLCSNIIQNRTLPIGLRQLLPAFPGKDNLEKID
jgi:hypothetical protein